MQEKLMSIKECAFNELTNADSSSKLEEIRVKYLGKKGELTTILRSMGGLSKEERLFVILHELWHVAKLHSIRRESRDPRLWNIACDYHINNL